MYGGRILILIPHPDDEAVGAAAAILRARGEGAAVFGLYLTTGVPGVEVAWRPDPARHAARVERRRAEALRAAELLGLEPAGFLDHPSRTLKDRLPDALAAVRRAVAAVRPDVLWVPAYEGGHQDHDSASALASLLAPGIPVWEFAEYNNAGGRTNGQSFPHPDGSERELRLTGAEAAAKRAALALYGSERGNLGHVESRRECFRPQARYDYAAPPHAGRVFYARFHWVPFRHPRVDVTTPAETSAAITAFLKGVRALSPPARGWPEGRGEGDSRRPEPHGGEDHPCA